MVSAGSTGALREGARALTAWLESGEQPRAADVAASLAASRAALPQRAVVIGNGSVDLLEGLRALAHGVPAPQVIGGGGDRDPGGKPVFVFSGHGGQWAGMGAELLDTSPAFAAQIRRCSEALAPYVDFELEGVLRGDHGQPALDGVQVIQPVLFAVMVSLAALWRSIGVEPAAVVGHSQGEIAAAHVAGGLSLEDAARVVALRSRALAALSGRGGMISVSLSREEAERRFARFGDELVVAALNAPEMVTLSGELGALDEVLAECEADEIRSRRVRIDYAAHSPQVEAIRDELLRSLTPVAPRSGDIPLYSTVTGARLDTARMDAEYWYEGERRPVQLDAVVRRLLNDGHRSFVEVSAHPVLTTGIQESIDAALPDPGEAAVLATLRRDQGGPRRFLTSLAEVYARGIDVSWETLFDEADTQPVELPAPAAAEGAAPYFVERTRAMSAEDRRRLVLDLVLAEVASVLGEQSARAVQPGRAFKEMGFDSAAAIEVRNRIAHATGLSVPTTLLFDHPSPRAVAERLVAEITGERSDETPAPATVRAGEPIAIVGIGCRYPGGVRSAEDLWELVSSGGDAIGDFPTDRGWDLEQLYDPEGTRPGTTYVRQGGFIYDAADFDAEHFSISPREALAMDPHQRLLLECSWEALEHAGIDPLSLRGSLTGVFAGIYGLDYGPRLHEGEERTAGYGLTGTLPAVVSGRVAYALGLEGPAVSVDTACSASLVSLHLACQALRHGECTLALAGGATVMSSPGIFVDFARQRGLSPDGRCRAYGAGANGTGFSDGVGVVVLEPLSVAEERGHRVLAVIRGSAINQDGASNGLTAPSGKSQERVIRQALASAGLGVDDVDAVEGHGTGTELGDPIEAGALLATYGRRSEGTVWLGSLKSNIGHTQAAAGVGGVIKMVMALRHRALPATLHADEPSPHVDWDAGRVRPLSKPVEWEQVDRPRRASVSSFGISGTNAHMVIEEAPAAAPPVVAPPRDVTPRPSLLPFLLSGSSEAGLAAQAGRLRECVMSGETLDPLGVAGSLALGRAQLPHRAVALAPGLEELAERLRGLERGEEVDGVVRGIARREARVGFVFPGQGGQWPGMALELFEQSPVFAERMEACAKAIAPHVDFDLLGVLRGEPGQPTLDPIEVVQPALFAVMISLAALWRSFGVEPAAVVGHSQGEIAAAHVAGALSLEDAARIVCVRSRCLAEIEGGGGMMAIALPAADFEERARAWDGRVTVAAVNGPASLVVSGDPEALDELERSLEADGVWKRRIASTVAGHSPHVEAAREEMLSALADVEPRASRLPLYSTVSGEQAATDSMGAEHWYRNLRQTVQFEPAVRALAGAGVDVLIEIGPHPVLAAPALEILESERDSGSVAAISTLRRDEGGLDRFVGSLAEAHVSGVGIDWESLFAGAERVELPTYAFQRSRYWLAPGSGRQDVGTLGQSPAEHPLLGAMVPLAGDAGHLFTARLSLESQPWLADHAALGTVLVPATAFLELALHAAAQTDTQVIDELTLAAPLTLEESGAVALQVRVSGPDDEGRRGIAVHSRPEGQDGDWTEHATGSLIADDSVPGAPPTWPAKGEELDPAAAYARLSEAGYEYGPVFQGLRRILRDGDAIHAEVALQEDQAGRAADFGLHPALSDAALHAAMLAGLEPGEAGRPQIPFSFAGVRLNRRGADALRVMVTGADRSWRIVASDAGGEPVLSIDALQTRPLDASRLASQRGVRDALFAVEWTAVSEAPEPRPGAVAAIGEALRLGDPAELGVEVYPDIAALLDAIEAGVERPEHVLAEVEPSNADLPEAAHAVAARALELVKTWLAAEPLADSRLVLVTRGALAVTAGERPDLRQAPVAGLFRSAHSEHPGRVAVIDIEAARLTREDLIAVLAVGEPEVAFREGLALVPRLQRYEASDSLVPDDGESEWHVSVQTPGTLDSLGVARHPRAGDRLGSREVRVQIHAAGINFRDVGVTLGLLEGGPEMQIGYEGAGVVTEVGEEVTDMSPGDRVMGLIPHSFGPVGVADRRHLARMPEGWSYTQAASVPLVFLTAWYGLVDLAGLKAGDSVLIHGAAGGVGMAALQIARHLGAEPFGTAHPRKWDALTSLGLADDHIASSRTTDFEAEFMSATAGRGVDVVLDSLAGPFVDASLRLLPRGGRFIEMGKTDIRDPEQVANDHPGVEYQAFDLRETAPERIGEMLGEIVELFEQGIFQPAPISSWDVRRAAAAFRVLRDSSHTGKLVFRIPQPARSDGTVLITGGTGGLGALLARRLVAQQEARRLLLVSRRGAEAPGAPELADELRALGAEVELAACDVSDRGALERLLSAIPPERPLTTIVHAAGALDDGVVTALDEARLRRVMTPKVDAAVHLHELTRELEIAEFILFSSAAAAVGSPGQANYAAANAFLDSLAVARQAEGLPAVSLAFGLWERATGLSQHLVTDEGMRAGSLDLLPMPDELGLQLIERARQSDAALLAPMLLDMAKLRQRAGNGVLSPVFTALVRAPSRAGGAAGTSLAATLAGAPDSERDRIVLDVVRTHAAAVLGQSSPEEIEADRSFKELGADSLSAVELRNRIAGATGVALPATLIFDYPTPGAVASFLRDQVEERREVSTAPATPARAADEPIAIVGIGCRYPGDVRSADDLWNLVASAGDAIGEFPTDRGWDLERLIDPDGKPGTSYVRHGGFVYDAAEFDAEHFSISPREALAMDPQQRLLLECAWEALEHAAIDPLSLRGTPAGVFVGAYASDYGVGVDAPEEVLGLRLTGEVTSVISGRVAYALGLEGPAVTIDTACSSSLVSLHMACQALRNGECSVALAGGVSVLATPMPFIEFSRQGGLSPDGRCRAYGAGANGTGFSDGAGLVVLEPLSVAEERGHRVLAVIRGSAMNQDGASNGLSAPSGPSQERVIRQALSNAGLEPADVDAVEGHGTGTELGDPIEAGALVATYGAGRSNGPLWLGSLKSNIGHSQTAAGVGGVIKMVMALQHGILPRTLYAEESSPHIDWGEGVRLLSEPVEWPRNGRPRRAGVSSFGISGTNAHLLLEEAPTPEPVGEPEELGLRTDTVPFLLSASSAAALEGQAGRLRKLVEDRPDLDRVDLARSLVRSRAQLQHRVVALAPGMAELAEQLRALERGEAVEGVLRGVARRGLRVGFVFPGQGGQWPGMALELFEQSPVFAERMGACAKAIAPHVDFDVIGVLRGDEGQPTLEPIEVVQPVLFAIMVSLAELWRSFGVEPAAVVGHSQGEIAAAHIAGGLSLEDAAMIVAVRSRELAKIEGGGGMMAVALPPDEFAERARDLDGRVSVAAVNGPASLVISGDSDALDGLERGFETDGIWARRIASTVAGHSPHVEVARVEMLSALAGVTPRTGELPIYSTVSGARATTETMDAEHWYRNLRQTVQFAPAVREMAQDGVTALIEISPHPVLTLAAEETVEAAAAGQTRVTVISSLRRDQGGLERFVRSVAEAHVAGIEIDWTALLGTERGAHVPLPTYAFQRRRYWLAPSGGARDATSLGQASAEHPLLDAVVPLAGGQGTVFTGRLSLDRHRWLADHVLAGSVVIPPSVFLELALHAGERTGAEAVEELVLGAPLRLDDQRAVALQVTVSSPDDDGHRRLAIYSRADSGGEAADWVEHATAMLATPSGAFAESATAAEPNGATEFDVDDLYDALERAGYDHGPAFQAVRRAWRQGNDLFAEASLPEGESESGGAFRLHPALLDAVLQPALSATSEANGGAPVAVEAWKAVHLHGGGASAVTSHLKLSEDDGSVQATLAGDDGRAVASFRATVSAAAGARMIGNRRAISRDSLLRQAWREVPTAAANDGRYALLGKASDLSAELEAHPDFASLAGSIDARAPEVPAVVADFRASPSGEHMTAAARDALARALELIQGMVAEERLGGSRLVFVTQGAVAAADGDAVPGLATAPLWGLVRSAQSEHPGRFALVDVDADASPAAVRAAVASGEPQAAVRQGRVLVPRLARIASGDSALDLGSAAAGTVLVTGGTSGVGAVLARHLVTEHRVEHLLLTSRRGERAPGAPELRDELATLGASVRIAACDAGDREQLEALLRSIPAERPLTGVVHAAGTADNSLVESMTPEQIDRVLAPKLDAAVHLHELTQDFELGLFVLCSSMAATFGGPGQGNYAAANAFLDALAERRRAEGLPGTSIGWGLWEDVGMARELGGSLEQLLRQLSGSDAFRPFPAATGAELFDGALATGLPMVLASPYRLEVVREEVSAGTAPHLLSGLTRSRPSRDAANGNGRRDIAGETRAQIAGALGYASPDSLQMHLSFLELGFDSLVSLELRKRLQAVTGLALPSTIMFDHPTPAALVEHLQGLVNGGDDAEAGREPLPAPGSANGHSEAAGLAPMFRRAHQLGKLQDGIALAEAAARLRPRFGLSHARDQAPPPITLAGGDEPLIFCVPSLVATSGPHEYARIAKSFRGDHEIVVLSAPGFRADELLPSTLDAVARAQAESIRRHADGRAFAIAGYSTGGLLAYAVARECAQDGIVPRAVVLIDSYTMDTMWRITDPVFDRLLASDGSHPPVSEATLTAMGAYLGLLSAWSPGERAAPTLLVRAADPLPGVVRSSDWKATWPHRDTAVEVPGTHFTILEDHAKATAGAIEEWLASEHRAGGEGRERPRRLSRRTLVRR